MKVVSEESPKKFRAKCGVCGTVVEYEASELGFRPWYPKGFVYCPKCGKPIRHSVDNKVE